jgi:hypothetical protein
MTNGNAPKTIWRNPHRRPSGREGNAPVFQVIQQADGRLNTRRLAAASPLQTVVNPSPRRRALSKRAGLLLFVLALVVLAFFAGAVSARAQEIGEPWCEISAPMPATSPAVNPAQAQINCIQPRMYIPLVISRGEYGNQSDRNHFRAGAFVSVGDHGRQASAIGSNRAAASAAGEDKGSGSRLR